MQHRLGAPWVLVALTALMTVGCGDDPPRQPAGVSERSAILPAAEVAGQTRRLLEVSAKPLLADGETMAVTRIDGQVVRLSARPVAAVEAGCRCEVEELGSPGPLVDGQPTRVDINDLNQSTVLATVGDQHLTLSSLSVSDAELAALVPQIALPLTRASVPGELVGVVSSEETTIAARASYRADDYSNEVTVFVATPEEQAAYLALLVEDPAELRETVDSCCPSELLRPPRSVSVLGVTGTIGTVGSLRKLLVVPGDPGVVLVSQADRIDPDGPSDDAVVAVLATADIGTPSELEALVASLVQEELDRRLDAMRASEVANGWQVLDERVVDDIPVVISTGDRPRPEPEALDLPPGSICVVYVDPSSGGPEDSRSSCLPPTRPDEPFVRITSDDNAPSTFVGSLRPDVERIELAFPEGTAPAEILAVTTPDGAEHRLFLLHLMVNEQIELTGDDLSAGMPQIAFVAYDAAGNELGRVPLFPHLQP